MGWDQFTSLIGKLMDKPLTISLSLVFTIGSFALLILSKTSLGKKAIKKFVGLYNEGERLAKETLKIANDTNERVRNVEILAKQKIDELKAFYDRKEQELKEHYEQKTAALVSIVNYYVESSFATLEKIPNAKVQEEVKALREGYEVKKEEITNVVGAIYQDYDAFKQKTEIAIRKEYEDKIAYLDNKYNELSLFINELKEGRIDGQGEESVNS